MKAKRWLFGILLTGVMMGCLLCTSMNNGFSVKAAASIEITETELTGDVKYNTSVVIKENLDLKGHTMQIDGDLEIAADVDLNMGMLAVKGNILHTSGIVTVNRGMIDVSGDYRIQNKRVLMDGTVQYFASEGGLIMKQDGDLVKIGGNFVTQSTYSGSYYRSWSAFNGVRYYDYIAGVMEIGGDIIQKNGNETNFFCGENHKVILVGEKTHKIEFESPYSGFAGLESQGDIIWNGYMRIHEMLSDLKVRHETGKELSIKYLDTKGKYLDIAGDVNFIGRIEMGSGIIKINGNVLHTDGVLIVDQGLLDISGDYRIQNATSLPGGTIRYTTSAGSIIMEGNGGGIRVSGDFITQSNKAKTAYYYYRDSSFYAKYLEELREEYNDFTITNEQLNTYKAGTIEVGGDLIQKNGSTTNFICTDSHQVILTGTKPQKVEFESKQATLNQLVIKNSLSNYTFNPNPCWNTLEESATSIADCTVKSISKQAYTGKAITPSLTITYEGAKLVKGTDYSVTYTNNKDTGKATVTIKGIGAYTGTVQKTFSIVPVKVASVKAASSAAKTATITWKEDKTATGYVIEYSTDKTFKKSVSKVTINKYSTTSRQIEKLTSKKTYYFRIRAYKTISGTKVYGAYSSVASVQVK